MARRMRSYTDVGSSNAVWLDSWKEKGLIKVWLHREPGWERRVHSFRRIELVEGKDGPTKQIKWLPFVCMEEEEFHKLRNQKGNDRPPIPRICPACRIIHALEHDDTLDDEEIIFSFSTGKRDRREMERIDIIGQGKRRDSYKDNLTAKSEHLIFVIEHDEPDSVKIANEGWGLAKALKQRVSKDIAALGDEDGNPSNTPICYTFEYDADAMNKFGVSRFPEAKVTDEIHDLWESEAPDVEKFCLPGDPEPFFKAAQDSITEKAEKVLDLEDIFEPALKWWKKNGGSGSKQDDDDDADFDPKKIEGRSSRGRDDDREERPRRGRDDDDREERPRRGRDDDREERPRRSRDDDREERPRRSRDDDREELRGERASSRKEEAPKEPPEEPTGRRSRRSRTEETAPKEPEKKESAMGAEMGVHTVSCPDCGTDWEIPSHKECPGCGMSISKIDEDGNRVKPEGESGGRSRKKPF